MSADSDELPWISVAIPCGHCRSQRQVSIPVLETTLTQLSAAQSRLRTPARNYWLDDARVRRSLSSALKFESARFMETSPCPWSEGLLDGLVVK